MYAVQDRLELGPLDQMFRPYYYCYLLCFPIADDQHESARQTLSTALDRLGEECPSLTASVHRAETSATGRGQMHLRLPASPQFIRREFVDLRQDAKTWPWTYEMLAKENFPLNKLDSRILAPLTAGNASTCQVMAMQANLFHGGLILAMCFHHNFADGSGAARIVARLSEHCAGTLVGTADRTEIPAVLSYPAAQASTTFEQAERDETLWRLNCLEWKDTASHNTGKDWPEVMPCLPPPRDPPVVSRMYSIVSEKFEQIVQAAKPDPKDGWVSSNDALIAFFWQHVMRARCPTDQSDISLVESVKHTDGISRGVVAMNGRKDLNIDDGFVGNCVFHCYADLSLDLVRDKSTSLSEVASSVRRAITSTRDPESLKRVIGLAATIPNVARIKYGNDNLGMDFYTTSWTALPFYDLDWGVIGKTEYLRVPDGHFETLCCILPRRKGHVEVILSMRESDHIRLAKDTDFTAMATLL